MSHVMGRHTLDGDARCRRYSLFRAQERPFRPSRGPGVAGRAPATSFVPRIWEAARSSRAQWTTVVRFRRRIERPRRQACTRATGDPPRRLVPLGMTGSAPISAELKAFVEAYLDLHPSMATARPRRASARRPGATPTVIDYKLADVPDPGLLPHRPAASSRRAAGQDGQLVPGLLQAPEVTAEVFDVDGYYRTWTSAEVGPDQLVYLDRRNFVLEAGAGGVRHRLETGGGVRHQPAGPPDLCLRQQRTPVFLAVVVPIEEAQARATTRVVEAAHRVSRTSQGPRICSRTRSRATSSSRQCRSRWRTACSPASATCAAASSSSTGDRLEQSHTELAEAQAGELRITPKRRRATGAGNRQPSSGCTMGAAAADLQPDAHFTDLVETRCRR